MTAVEERRYIRSDGLPKVTGQARYAADLTMSGMTHAAFLYAGVPSARIRRLDTAAARALPGRAWPSSRPRTCRTSATGRRSTIGPSSPGTWSGSRARSSPRSRP